MFYVFLLQALSQNLIFRLIVASLVIISICRILFPFLSICFLKEKAGGKGKKWKIWKSSSGDFGGPTWKNLKKYGGSSDFSSDSSSVNNDAFNAAVATVVRAPPKDFKVVKQEWAAIRIQTAFRGFLVSISNMGYNNLGFS